MVWKVVRRAPSNNELATLVLKEFGMMKTLKTKLSPIPMIFLVFLVACTPIVSQESIATSEIEPSATVTAVSTLQPTDTVVTATPSPTPLPQVKTQCTDNAQESQALDLEGVVVLEKTKKFVPELDLPPGFYLMNADSHYIFHTDNLGNIIKIAPDGKNLVYNKPFGEGGALRVMDVNGKLLTEFDPYYKGLWGLHFSWQNEEQLRIVTSNLNQVYPWIVNPFTEEHTLLKTDWEGAYRPADPIKDKVANWKFDRDSTELFYVYGANVLYDPILSRVLFPKDSGDVVLIDVQSGEELAHANFVNWGSLPSWSSDGEYLTILNREGTVDNFYLISRDGEEFQHITDFASEFEFASIPEYTWSPDSTRIAFWLKLKDDGQQRGTQSELAILEIPTRQVTRLCIQGISNIADEPLWMNHPEPIWSPDGRFIMFTQWDDLAAPEGFFVLVVDTETGAVEKISKNTAPAGWMTNDQ